MRIYPGISHGKQGMMGSKRKSWRKIGFVLLAVLVIEMLFDPLTGLIGLSESIQARVELPYARKRWDSQHITHYQFDIWGGAPLACIYSGRVEVRNETIISAGPLPDTGKGLSFGLPRGPSSHFPLCNLQTFTISGLFNVVEEWTSSSITKISFDPKYGFITHFGFGSPGGRGLFSPIISDCCGGFTISNFQVLEK